MQALATYLASRRSNLPVPLDELDELGDDEPWVHQALDQLALECTEVLDDLLPPRQFDPFSTPPFVIPFQDSSMSPGALAYADENWEA